MARSGSIFKRCTRCGKRVSEPRCTCGNDKSRWAYKADIGARGGVRRQLSRSGFRTKTEAVDAMREKLTEWAAGNLAAPSKITFGELMTAWLTNNPRQLRRGTLMTYKNSWRRVEPLLGAIRLQSLTGMDLAGAYGRLAAGDTENPALADSTVHNIHIVISAALTDAVKHRFIRDNPASRAHRGHVHRAERVWSRAERSKFLAWSKSQNSPFYSFWFVAASTGLRRGELLGLRWHDIKLDEERLSVRSQLLSLPSPHKDGPKFILTYQQPKTNGSRRTVPLDEATIKVLLKHRTEQSSVRHALGMQWGEDDLVFAHVDGTPYTPGHLTRSFGTETRQAGMPRLTIHGPRSATHLRLPGPRPRHPYQDRAGTARSRLGPGDQRHLQPPPARRRRERRAGSRKLDQRR